MKYVTEIEIELPLDEFVKKLDNPSNMKHWQRGLLNFEHVSGNPGKVGAKMRYNYRFGKRKMELLETIIENKLPNYLELSFDSVGINNIQKNTFKQTSIGTTKWICENNYLPTNLTMRFLSIFMKNGFKKQTLMYMTDFKNFAETGVSVSNIE